MKASVEIDSIEVNDSLMDITYWLSNEKRQQSIIFKVKDFENWLTRQRKVSASAYWDHWDVQDHNNPNHQLFINDVEAYLAYRVEMFQTVTSRSVIQSTERKPMTRVSKSASVNKGKSA